MQKSYIKDTRDFINALVERAQIHEGATPVSMDCTSLLSNIPQEKGKEQYVRHPGGGGGILVQSNTQILMQSFEIFIQSSWVERSQQERE